MLSTGRRNVNPNVSSTTTDPGVGSADTNDAPKSVSTAAGTARPSG
jgi:hypothetical protein